MQGAQAIAKMDFVISLMVLVFVKMGIMVIIVAEVNIGLLLCEKVKFVLNFYY